MEQRTNFLALTLLDALEDGNESDIYSMLERNVINASFVLRERGIAPIHYVCGMSNEELGLDMVKRFLAAGADPNVRCDGNMTPLHIAAMYGRVEIVRELLTHGARVHMYDDENKLPVHYAIEELHFEILQLMRDHIFLQKFDRQQKEKQRKRKEQQQVDKRKVSSLKINCLESPNGDGPLTPHRVNYNYDVTSPFYINITHRRHQPQPQFPALVADTKSQSKLEDTLPVNIFSLTKENLAEMTNTTPQSATRTRRSLIETWRAKVERSRARQSQLQQCEEMAELVDQAIENDDFNLLEYQRNKLHSADGAETLPEEAPKTTTSNLQELTDLVEQVAKARIVTPKKLPAEIIPAANTDTATNVEHLAPPEDCTRQGLIRSPKQDKYFLQMTEAYVHTDDERGLVFYETKLLNNVGNKVAQAAVAATEVTSKPNNKSDVNTTVTSLQSTNLTLPLDYETDELRAELTQFGERVGPITKSTKRLYIKRLIKYKRNPEHMLALRQHALDNEAKFSVELQRTLRTPENFKCIVDYLSYETASAAYFMGQQTTRAKKPLREGHLKQSFIYMLIDPRISCNLPGESVYLEKFDVWQRFLNAIFYVGKGKSSRPYAHLYEAMKTHSRAHQQQHVTCAESTKAKIVTRKPNPESFKSPPPAATAAKFSQKLSRILEIWQCGQGVVCLHVFHNIMPTEAYTREAAIIDALGMKHLTNLKRGDYYGPSQTWTMKQKKYLGIALLYKALHIYLAEGESQLSPSDLI